MEEKRIAETLTIRISLGPQTYEHIELTKYAEKKITYETPEEMIKKEDELTDELLVDMIRSMRRIPERLGKKGVETVEVEERIAKRIPKWLEENPVPNIAGTAEIKHHQAVERQKEDESKVASKKESDKDFDLDLDTPAKREAFDSREVVGGVIASEPVDESDLF